MGRFLGVVALVLALGFYSPAGAENPVENVAVISAYPVIFADPATAQDWYDAQVMYNLYSPLVYPTPEGTIRPHLAESWEPVEGQLDHWRFTLRQGVRFHDGSELTAEDVAFSMNRLMAMGRGYSGMMGKVTATAIDRYVVDFTLEKPNAVFPETLTLFWPLNKEQILEHLGPGDYGEFGDYGEEWLATHDAGTGPYMMTSHSPGQRLEAVRFEDYFLGWDDEGWGPDEVPIERLIFIMEVEYTTLMTLLKNGDLDLEANGGWTLTQLDEIERTEGIRVVQVWSEDVTVWMNTQKPPTDDENFRKAILYAYDYEAVMAPYVPYGAREGGIYLSKMPGYVPIPPQPRKKDLEKAREYLAKSKYDPAKVGPVSVVFHFAAGLSYEEDIGLQLQADLAELGINVEVAGPPWPQYSAECTSPETTPNMTIFLFAPQYPTPDFYMYSLYHPEGLGWIFEAHWYFEDEEINRLLDQTRATYDFDERVELYRQLQPMIADHALALYPYEKPKPFAAQDYLVGPKELFEMVGPNINMHNWRINLKLKEELRG